MTDAPTLTDRTALGRNRARARLAPALVLHEMAADDIQDRLDLVNREFTAPAVITPFPEVWEGRLQDARIVPDDEVLSLDPGAHDLVLHALAMHWADDPVGQLIQSRRALKPDGLFMGTAFGGETLTELRAALGQAEIEIAGGLSPRVAPMADIRDLGALLQRAGLAMPVADSFAITATYESPIHLMHDLRAMGEANAMSARVRHPTRRAVLMRAAELYVEGYAMDDGRVPATFEFVSLTGWAPDESQPQPLRPGSATHRLAEALNTGETPLKD